MVCKEATLKLFVISHFTHYSALPIVWRALSNKDFKFEYTHLGGPGAAAAGTSASPPPPPPPKKLDKSKFGPISKLPSAASAPP
jgi:hypothetical protein